MKTTILIAAAIITSILTCAADNSRYVTLTLTPAGDGRQIDVLPGETAEIVICQYATGSGGTTATHHSVDIIKDGTTVSGYPPGYAYVDTLQAPMPQGTVVAGPATIRPRQYTRPSATPGLLTVKITPATYDVNKTLILPPSTNQVYIALESSTNLLHWADTTNGLYGSPDTARFFRIRMEKSN